MRTSEIDVDDLDGISLASSASDRTPLLPEQRQRSLSFDDLYALAPMQGGFTGASKFAFIPLEGDEKIAVKKSASNDDLQALAEMAAQAQYHTYKELEQELSDDESVGAATVKSMPVVPSAVAARPSRRKGTSLDGADSDQDLDGLDSFSAAHSEISGASNEEESPAERLFGKARAAELRQRITRGRNVTPQAAQEALDAATAAMMGSESSETIEFITWFSVWLLLMFWLLFYSSYGPMLWRFLYGPMGLVLCLPFGFALLFWLMAYVFSAVNDD